jgi:iron(III) transport system permease protein
VKSKGLPLVLLAIVAALVVPPVIILIISAFAEGETLAESTATLDNFTGVLGDKYTYTTLWDTMVFSVGTALLTVLLAASLAWFVERTNAPMRRAVYGLMIVAFAIPTFIQGMGWVLFLGPRNGLLAAFLKLIFGENIPEFPLYTMPVMIAIQAMTLLPAIFLLIAPAMRASDPVLEEAASVSGASRLQIIRKVTLPLMLPGVLAALFLSFIVAVETFEVPALIGTPGRIVVLSTEVYSKIRRAFPDYGAASAFSVLMMVITIIGLYNYQRATARTQKYTTVTGKGYRPSRADLGRWRWLAGVYVLGLPLLVVAPVVMIIWASFLRSYEAPSVDALSRLTTDTYVDVLQTPEVVGALGNSLMLGILSAVFVMAITAIAAWLLVRRRSGITRSVDFLLTLPLVIPGVVLSLAVLRTYISLPIPIYGTQMIVLLALVIHYVPYGMRYGHAGVVALHPELEEAAQIAGARQWTVMRRILVPLLWPSLIAGGAFVFLATIRQLSLVLFLAGPGNEVVAPTMFSMWQVGSISEAAAFAVIVVVVVGVVLGVFSKLTSGLAIGSPEGADAAAHHDK